MNDKAKLTFRILIGAIIIGGSFYVSFKYLFKSPPFIKVLVLIALASITYLTISNILKKNNKDWHGN